MALKLKMRSYIFLVLFMGIFLRCSSAQILRFNSLPRCIARGHGEPHIETCNDNGTDTICYAPGLQTYLDNFFLRVTVVHTIWRPNVTVITEVLVDFKSLAHPHAITYTYRASNAILPTVFEYEAASISAIDTVNLSSPGADTVELIWPFTGIIIVIDNWSGLFQFTMSGSQAVMNTGTGMLIDGCPPQHVTIPVGRGGVVIGKRRKRQAFEEATAACLENKVPVDTADMRACIFDVVVTGDTAIAAASGMARADRERVMSMGDELGRSAGVWPGEGKQVRGGKYRKIG